MSKIGDLAMGVVLGTGLLGGANPPNPGPNDLPGTVPEDAFDLAAEQDRERREKEAKGLSDEEQRNASVAEEQAREAAQKTQDEANAASEAAQREANEMAQKQQDDTNAANEKARQDAEDLAEKQREETDAASGSATA